MGYWKNQSTITAVDDSTLTALYSGNTSTLDAGSRNLLTIYAEYTAQETTAYALIQIEAGFDSDNLFQINNLSSDSTGVSTVKQGVFKIESGGIGTAVKRRIGVCLADVKFRISAKETVSSTFGTITLTVIKNEQS